MLANIKTQEELTGSTNRNAKGSRSQDKDFSDKVWDSLEVSVSAERLFMSPSLDQLFVQGW